MKHYIVDIERGEYLSIGEILTSNIEASGQTYLEIIEGLTSLDPDLEMTKGFLSQLCSDKQKIPNHLIKPIISIIMVEKQSSVQRYYASEILRAYLPSDLSEHVSRPLNSLKNDAERLAKRYANHARKTGLRNPDCIRQDAGEAYSHNMFINVFDKSTGPTGLDEEVDFAWHQNEGIRINSYLNKRQRNAFHKNKVRTVQTIEGEAFEAELRELSREAARQQSRSGTGTLRLFEDASSGRHGDCIANAILQMQRGNLAYFQHRFSRSGKATPDSVFLSRSCEAYIAKGGNVEEFEALLYQYFEQSERDSKAFMLSDSNRPFIDTWKASRLREKTKRSQYIEAYKDDCIENVADARQVAQNAFELYYFDRSDRFFQDGARALQRPRYFAFRQKLLKLLVADWSKSNLDLVDILYLSIKHGTYKTIFSKAFKGVDRKGTSIWDMAMGKKLSDDEFEKLLFNSLSEDIGDHLSLRRYDNTFSHFLEQKIFQLHSNVRRIGD